jgi:hypothetical protein
MACGGARWIGCRRHHLPPRTRAGPHPRHLLPPRTRAGPRPQCGCRGSYPGSSVARVLRPGARTCSGRLRPGRLPAVHSAPAAKAPRLCPGLAHFRYSRGCVDRSRFEMPTGCPSQPSRNARRMFVAAVTGCPPHVRRSRHGMPAACSSQSFRDARRMSQRGFQYFPPPPPSPSAKWPRYSIYAGGGGLWQCRPCVRRGRFEMPAGCRDAAGA